MPAVEVQPNAQFVHRIDADGNIASVNRDWLRFAAENGWSNSVEDLCNTPLMQYISGLETQHVYKMLIDKVRFCQDKIAFKYRCDSPDCRRHMWMEINYEVATDTVEFRSRVLRLEPRRFVDLLDSGRTHRGNEILEICSWCKLVLVKQQWVEIEEAVRELGLFEFDTLPKTSHGICPACMQDLTAKGVRL